MVSRYNDQEFDAGLEVIKDSSVDLSGLTGTAVTNNANDGWWAKRYVEFAATSPGGVRHIARDKEYGFRPKIAKLVHDSVVYRDFREPPGGGSGNGAGSTVADDQALLTMGVQGTVGGAGGVSSWVVGSEEVGFEVGLISDTKHYLKSNPHISPSHYNGENQSTLVHSKEDLEAKDKGYDLPRRYFGRAHDFVVAKPTQNVKLKRVRYKGGFFSKTKSTEDYDDGFWKAVWNVTPYDQPFRKTLDQKNEENNGPGEHGYAPHDYSTAISEAISIAPPVFQGGWMYDGVLDVLGQIHDVLGIGKGSPYRRYLAKNSQEVALVYVRHDAIFAKTPTTLGRFHFKQKETFPEGLGIPFWGDIYLDEDKKGIETKMEPHETGQWRPIYRVLRDWATPGPKYGAIETPSGQAGPVRTPQPSQISSGALTSAYVDFDAGVLTGMGMEWTIPSDLAASSSALVKVPVNISGTLASGQTIKLIGIFKPQGECDEIFASPLQVDMTIREEDWHGASGVDCNVYFQIPNNQIAGRENGTLAFELFRGADDTFENTVRINEAAIAAQFYPQSNVTGIIESYRGILF